jgi:plastocyanin
LAKKKRKSQQATRTRAPVQEGQALSPEEQAARRAQQKREWAERKHGKQRESGDSIAPLIWGGSAIVAVVVAVVVGIVLIAGGGGSSASPTPAVTADPRLGGGSPVEEFNISADDDGVAVNPRFSPTVITAVAGEVFQINVKNDGSSVHNLDIAGLDDTYDTPDDWVTRDSNNSDNPLAILVGDTGTLQVKIDKPGTYRFRCTFHPVEQIGTLILTPGPSSSAGPSGSAAASASASLSPTPSPTP